MYGTAEKSSKKRGRNGQGTSLRDRRKKWGPKIDGRGEKQKESCTKNNGEGGFVGREKMTLRRRYVAKESLELRYRRLV